MRKRQLLGRASSINMRKVLWTCDELGLEPELVEWCMGCCRCSRPASWPSTRTAPGAGDRRRRLRLWESNTICRYLAAREGRADLLPQQPAAGARVEQWMDWQATELNTAWRHAFMGLVRQHQAFADAAGIAASTASWNRHMALLDAALQRTGAFVTGDHFTLADVVLGLATHRWYATPIERPPLAAVAAYYAQLSARPGFMRHGRNGLP